MTVDDDNPTAKQYVLDPAGAWEVGQEIVSRAPTSFDDGKNETTPIVLDLCVCGDSKKYVGEGTLMPADEPTECVWEIGGCVLADLNDPMRLSVAAVFSHEFGWWTADTDAGRLAYLALAGPGGGKPAGVAGSALLQIAPLHVAAVRLRITRTGSSGNVTVDAVRE